MSVKKIFDYCDELTNSDLLDFRNSSKLASAKLGAEISMTKLKNVLEELDNADFLDFGNEDDEDFQSVEEIFSLFDF